MTQALADDFGNASSVHAFGQKAKAHLDLARARVATLIGAEPNDLVWTAGGTEADNFAVRGIAEALQVARAHAPGRQRDRTRGGAQHVQAPGAPRLDPDVGGPDVRA